MVLHPTAAAAAAHADAKLSTVTSASTLSYAARQLAGKRATQLKGDNSSHVTRSLVVKANTPSASVRIVK